MARFLRAVLCAALFVALLLAVRPALDTGAEASPSVAHHVAISTPPAVPEQVSAAPSIGEIQVALVVRYIQAVEQQHLGEYLAAVAQAEQERAAEAAAQQAAQEAATQETARPSEAAVTTTPTVSGGGSCYGGPIPDYIVTRESGGDPTAMNPSGAWGCYQIMPEWWSGACAAYDRYTIDGQKACAAILWNGGAGASNWSTG